MTFLILSHSESQPTTTDSSLTMAEPSFYAGGAGVLNTFVQDQAVRRQPKEGEDFADIGGIVSAIEANAPLAREARQWAGSVLYGDDLRSLRALRLSRGLSQKEFAKQLATDQAIVSRWENGHLDMRVSTIKRIAAVLEVSLDRVCYAVCASATVVQEDT